jgi:membrane associated rhomboid family serine protease
MDSLLRMTTGAPAATVLLAAILVLGTLGLTRWPALVDRHLLRPHGLARRGDWHTLATSGFIHADLPHLAFNAFTFFSTCSFSSTFCRFRSNQTAALLFSSSKLSIFYSDF